MMLQSNAKKGDGKLDRLSLIPFDKDKFMLEGFIKLHLDGFCAAHKVIIKGIVVGADNVVDIQWEAL